LVNMTGGLQDQVTDGEGNWFGIGLEPASKAVIGSQSVPYIYEDRVNKEEFLDALVKLYEMGPTARAELGSAGQKFVQKNFGFSDFIQRWDDLLTEVHETCGSHEDRTNYKSYDVRTY